ncbi:GAD-like domain-containing protein [Nocardia salmonicida]|uniref:GAD-like domain-containing protein n=1 Tax=Nocardia salmonicida TaxID=53431 RepID=UPI0037886611
MGVEALSKIGVEQVLARLGAPYSVVPADNHIVDRYSGIVPDILLDVWRSAGFSGYSDGAFWLCNPDEWQPAVDDWLYGLELPFDDEWVPFTRTALGSVSLWGRRTGRSLSFYPHNGFVIPNDRSEMMDTEYGKCAQILVGANPDPAKTDFDGDDGKRMFRRLCKRLGKVDSSTMYGCVPAVGLGGSFTPKGMQIVKAVDHVRFLSTVTPRQVMNWKF